MDSPSQQFDETRRAKQRDPEELTWSEKTKLRRIAMGTEYLQYLFKAVLRQMGYFSIFAACIFLLALRRRHPDFDYLAINILCILMVGFARLIYELAPRKITIAKFEIRVKIGSHSVLQLKLKKGISVKVVPIADNISRIEYFESPASRPRLVFGAPFSAISLIHRFESCNGVNLLPEVAIPEI